MNTYPAFTERRTLGERVYEQLREAIITLRFEPGRMVYENELSESLGVSRTPVREAIRLLSSERLIDVLPQRGTRIAPISLATVEEARFVRASLESATFRLAAERWTDDERHRQAQRQIAHWLDQQRSAQVDGDAKRFLQADEAFHRTVLELAGNRMLSGIVYRMRGHLNRLRYLALKSTSETAELIAEHERMAELLAAGEADEAAKLVEQHLGKLRAELPELRGKYPHFFAD